MWSRNTRPRPKVWCLFRRVLLAALLPASLAAAAPAPQPGKAVSLNLCTDALLLLLAPERIAALSPLARDPSLNVFAAAAQHYPWVRPEAESVLALHPGLVLAGSYGAADTIALLEARGIRVVRLAEPATLAAIDAQITRAAAVLDVPARGAAVLAQFHAQLSAIPPAHGQRRAVLWEAHGYTAGPGSFAASLLAQAGLANAGTGGVMDIEAMIAEKPELLVTATPPATPALATDMLWHPALRGVARITLNPAWLACAGPWSVPAVQRLAGAAMPQG